jgi:uncharacterized protein (TIGR02147 family)
MILDSRQLFATLLKKYLELAKERNKKFSMRAFASKLGISSAAMSELMNGKRSISEEKALEIGRKIPFSNEDLIALENSFNKNKSIEKLKIRSNSRKEVIIDKSEFDIMSDWRYFAFMSLTRTSGFKSEISWIAKRLNVSKVSVKKIIDRLHSLDIISVDKKGNIVDNNVCYRTGSDFPKKLLNKRQLSGLEAAQESIKNENKNQIGFFSTITTDTKKIEEASVMIEDFLKKLSLFLADSSDRQEVFELQVQLFPRSHN